MSDNRNVGTVKSEAKRLASDFTYVFIYSKRNIMEIKEYIMTLKRNIKPGADILIVVLRKLLSRKPIIITPRKES